MSGNTTGFIKLEGITKQTGFKFRALLNWKRGAEFAEEFIAGCKKAEEEGIRLGSKKGKGKGLFSLISRLAVVYVGMLMMLVRCW